MIYNLGIANLGIKGILLISIPQSYAPLRLAGLLQF
jgi:hypothetical protein